MFRKLFRTALKTGLASVDLLDTLVKRIVFPERIR